MRLGELLKQLATDPGGGREELGSHIQREKRKKEKSSWREDGARFAMFVRKKNGGGEVRFAGAADGQSEERDYSRPVPKVL